MWQPAVQDKTIRKGIETKLKDLNEVISKTEAPGSGFYGGEAGLLLFLNYFNKYSESSLNDPFIETKIEKIFNSLDSLGSGALSTGYTGINWVIEHLISNGFIDLEDELFHATEDVIKAAFINMINDRNYDFMHGSFGSLFYFSEMSHKLNFHDELKLFRERIYKDFHIDDSNFGIETHLNIDGTRGYSLGLSHGVPAYIMVLIRLLESNSLDADVVKDLVAKNYKFMMQFEYKNPEKSFFPHSIVNNAGSPSRLSWCYGDLGCALAIYKYGQLINDKTMMNKAIEIILFNSKKRDPAKLGISDADFCHGTVGIAHFFSRFYNYTQVEEFRQAAEYWYGETLNYAKYSDGLCGYKHLHQMPDQFVSLPGMLEGVSGIGLCLISAIENIEPKWDKAFLLS